MPVVLKVAVINAFEKIHWRGVLHGNIQLSNILIGADMKVKLVNFEKGAILEGQPDLQLHRVRHADLDLEMRKVKYMLDYPSARKSEKERYKMERQWLKWMKKYKHDVELARRTSPFAPTAGKLDLKKFWRPENNLPGEKVGYLPVRHVMPGVTPEQYEEALVGFLEKIKREEDDYTMFAGAERTTQQSTEVDESNSPPSTSIILPSSIKIRDFALEGRSSAPDTFKERDHLLLDHNLDEPPKKRKRDVDSEDEDSDDVPGPRAPSKKPRTLDIGVQDDPNTRYILLSTDPGYTGTGRAMRWNRTASPTKGILLPLREGEVLPARLATESNVSVQGASELRDRMANPPLMSAKRKRKDRLEEEDADSRPKKGVSQRFFLSVSSTFADRHNTFPVRFAEATSPTGMLAFHTKDGKQRYLRMVAISDQPVAGPSQPRTTTQNPSPSSTRRTRQYFTPLHSTSHSSPTVPPMHMDDPEYRILQGRGHSSRTNIPNADGSPSPLPTPPDSDPEDDATVVASSSRKSSSFHSGPASRSSKPVPRRMPSEGPQRTARETFMTWLRTDENIAPAPASTRAGRSSGLNLREGSADPPESLWSTTAVSGRESFWMLLAPGSDDEEQIAVQGQAALEAEQDREDEMEVEKMTVVVPDHEDEDMRTDSDWTCVVN